MKIILREHAHVKDAVKIITDDGQNIADKFRIISVEANLSVESMTTVTLTVYSEFEGDFFAGNMIQIKSRPTFRQRIGALWQNLSSRLR